MRLNTNEISTIKRELLALDPEASIYLFGSRTNDAAKGGDIDLLIESNQFDMRTKAAYRWALMEELGEQKIDLVIHSEKNYAFVKQIKSHAIKL